MIPDGHFAFASDDLNVIERVTPAFGFGKISGLLLVTSPLAQGNP